MIRRRDDLPEPFRPSTPIFAPGKKLREMFLRIVRLGGTTFATLRIVYTYWAIPRMIGSFHAEIPDAHRPPPCPAVLFHGDGVRPGRRFGRGGPGRREHRPVARRPAVALGQALAGRRRLAPR